jgi:ATP-dependent Lon protease
MKRLPSILKKSLSDDEDFYPDPFNEQIKKKKAELEDFNKDNVVYNSFDVETRLLLSGISLGHKYEILKKIKEINFVESSKYLSWVNNLLKIPFGNYSKPVIENKGTDEVKDFLLKSRKLLDSVVYKQEECKESILDFCCKLISNPESRGKVLAIQSSKGMGKTKLIRQGLSKILNRPFFTINFGGLTDPAILTGHDFTYTGSRYGRICQILMDCKVADPIIYLDEIDKIGNDVKSKEVFGVLTHLLDEEQNKHFNDNYFQGISIDLSRVLFVISFNNIENVDNIVSDRMKIIKVPELTRQDKKTIIEEYMLPEILKDNGFKKEDVIVENNIKEKILNMSENQQGMRQIKKNIETIIERMNRFYISGDISLPFVISFDSLKSMKICLDDTECKYNQFYI